MALTVDQKSKLRAALIIKLTEATIANLSWNDLQSGIDSLSTEDKAKIVAALSGKGISIADFINSKLRTFAQSAVEIEVDALISQDYVPITLLYRVLT